MGSWGKFGLGIDGWLIREGPAADQLSSFTPTRKS
jgi:hypothetical protein